MLPDIIEMAQLHHVKLNQRTIHHKEVLAKCPFCQEDSKPGKHRRYYLSLNSKDHVFRCWHCDESGGVYRFISLLEGVTEEEVKRRYQGNRKKGLRQRKRHPVEQWSTSQRRAYLAHYIPKVPDLHKMRQRDYEYYLRTLDWMQMQWNELVQHELEQAFFWLLLGIHSGRYEHYVAVIQVREKQMEIPLLNPVLELFSSASRPAWTEEIEAFIQKHMNHPLSPEPQTAGMEMEV